MMLDRDKKNEEVDINTKGNVRHRDQAEGGEELGEVEPMVDKTPGQAEGERELIEEKLRKQEDDE